MKNKVFKEIEYLIKDEKNKKEILEKIKEKPSYEESEKIV